MKKLSVAIIASLCFLSTTTSYADSQITSPEIVADTMRALPSCIHYKVTGICYWMECVGPFCSINTTLKLDHYLPDLVESVYTKPTNNPWLFDRNVLDPIAKRIGKMEMKQLAHENRMEYSESHNNTQLDIDDRFHEIDVNGNPALTALHWGEFLLPSAASIFMPYFSSMMDSYAWRYPALERFYPQSYLPGVDDVGIPILHDWGQLYPRNGFLSQPDDAKAAAVIALRAATIITQPAQPHVYQPLGNSCGDHCDIDSVEVNSSNTKFQMIYPKVDSTCMVFGHSDAGDLHPWGMDDAQKGNDRYVWIVWRHYHGCIQGAGRYLYSISF